MCGYIRSLWLIFSTHCLALSEGTIKVHKLPGSRGWLPQHGTATLRPATRTLWECCARWARRSFAGPHPSLFVLSGIYTQISAWATCQCVCAGHAPHWSWLSLDFQACSWTCPISTQVLLGDLGYGWFWYHSWTCSSLLLGYHGASLCVHEDIAMPAMLLSVTPAHNSLQTVVQLVSLLSDIQFHNNINRSNLKLLKVHFCPWNHFPPSTQAMVPIKLYMALRSAPHLAQSS